LEAGANEALAVQIKPWKWIRRVLRKDSSAIEKQVLNWNPLGTTQKRKTEKELEQNEGEGRCNAGGGKTSREVKATAASRVRWRCCAEARSSRRKST
jgi:hypothetical protein